MTKTKRTLLWLMSAFYVFAGTMHMLQPALFVAIVPEGLPSPEWLNLISGLIEITLGVYVLEPRTRVLAAWGLIALLLAVFPANINAAIHNVGPQGPGTGIGAGNWVRLPFQAVFIAWAWWYTRPDAAPIPAASANA